MVENRGMLCVPYNTKEPELHDRKVPVGQHPESEHV